MNRVPGSAASDTALHRIGTKNRIWKSDTSAWPNLSHSLTLNVKACLVLLSVYPIYHVCIAPNSPRDTAPFAIVPGAAGWSINYPAPRRWGRWLRFWNE